MFLGNFNSFISFNCH